MYPFGFHRVALGRSQFTWSELEELIIKEYADDATAIEAMCSLMKLMPLKEVTPGALGVCSEKLVALTFPEEVRRNTIMQVQLAVILRGDPK